MKIKLALLIFSFVLPSHAAATQPSESTETSDAPEVEIDIPQSKENDKAVVLSNDIANFCFFSGSPRPEFEYITIRKLKLGKGTYGGVKEILPRFAENAQKAGADAIIKYTGSQRFGFLPWRMVRPVVRGVAVKWRDPKNKDCSIVGGTTLSAILTEDKPPAR